MIVWNILRKIILIPVILALTMIEWCGTFLTGVANMVIGLIALLLIVIAGLSAVMGIASGTECLRMAGIALGCVVLSNLLILIVGMIGGIRNMLIEYL